MRFALTPSHHLLQMSTSDKKQKRSNTVMQNLQAVIILAQTCFAQQQQVLKHQDELIDKHCNYHFWPQYQCLEPIDVSEKDVDPCRVYNREQYKLISQLKYNSDDNMKQASIDFELSRYAEGSPLELLRQAAASLPVPATVMNDRVRLYTPDEEDKYQTLEDGRYVNRLYSGVKLREYEEQKVLEFRSWLTESGLYVPPGYTDAHNYDLKYLNTLNYDHQKTYEEILANAKLIKDEVIPSLQNYQKLQPSVERGFIYGFGRDKKMRPIIIMNGRKIVDANAEGVFEEFSQVCDIVGTYTVTNAMVPGLIEQQIEIIDMRGVALTEIPLQHIVGVIQHGTLILKHRANVTLIIGVNWFVRAGTNFLFNFLDPFQRQKVIFFGDDFEDYFSEKIGLENLEEKFGGRMPTVEANFFPPHFNLDEHK